MNTYDIEVNPHSLGFDDGLIPAGMLLVLMGGPLSGLPDERPTCGAEAREHRVGPAVPFRPRVVHEHIVATCTREPHPPTERHRDIHTGHTWRER